MDHRHQIAVRSRDQVDFTIGPRQLFFEHDHGENRCPGGDIAGARCDAMCGHHAGARVALGRAKRNPGGELAGRVEQAGARRRQGAGFVPGDQDLRQDVTQPPGILASGDPVIELPGHHGIERAGFQVNREHA